MGARTRGALSLAPAHRSEDPRSRARGAQAAMPYARARHFANILERRAVRTVYQPLVDLESGAVLGFEALSRGPVGSPLERPDLLFGAARDVGMVAELDWVCRAKAMEGAMEAGMPRSLTLFINVEPDVPLTAMPSDVHLILKRAEQRLRVVLEVTERALLERPAELLSELTFARGRWWGVALDDVGANPDSLALMPLVHPDVIKMDFTYVRRQWSEDEIRVLRAVNHQAETTGATILAEGIETDAHLARARELGATIGQGWLFGRPTPLPDRFESPLHSVRLLGHEPPPPAASPFEIVEEDGPPQVLREAHVRKLAARIEQRALFSHEAPLVLGAFPPQPGPWSSPMDRFGRLVARAAFVGAVGQDVAPEVGPGYRFSPLSADDEMSDEWVLACIAAHHSEVMVAYDAGERDPEGHRLLEVATSTDRGTVSRVCELLMNKLGRSLAFTGVV